MKQVNGVDTFTPEASVWKEAQTEGRLAASLFRLPFQRSERGTRVGNWAGVGSGSSIDFQDHRAYAPGDDPRHINWQAYARTGDYTMKLYREEISPRADVVLDTSHSMFYQDDKRQRVLELLAFVLAGLEKSGASMTLHALGEDRLSRLPAREWNAGKTPDLVVGGESRPATELVPWRPHSLRILISDLLYPSPPESVLKPMLSTGHSLIFCPYHEQEAKPRWEGNLELRDCESTRYLNVFISPTALEQYQERYQRHFQAWQSSCERWHASFCRFPEDGRLNRLLGTHGLKTGIVTPWT